MRRPGRNARDPPAPKPLRYALAALGFIALTGLATTLFLLDWSPVAELGDGVERWVAYPVLLWMLGFGAHLAGAPRGTP